MNKTKRTIRKKKKKNTKNCSGIFPRECLVERKAGNGMVTERLQILKVRFRPDMENYFFYFGSSVDDEKREHDIIFVLVSWFPHLAQHRLVLK